MDWPLREERMILMFKFLVKTAVTVGIVGLALEGVKKVLQNRDEKQNADLDKHCEEYITITPSFPVETEANTPVEPEESVENVELVDNAKPVQKADLTEEESQKEGSNPTEESIVSQSVAE